MPVKYEIGDRLLEAGSGHSPAFSSGRILATADSPARGDIVYLLLRSDAGEYTVYAAMKDAYGKPWVPRMIPGEAFKALALAAQQEIELPPEKEQPSKPEPVATKRPARTYGPAPVSEEGGASPSDEDAGSLFCPGVDILFDMKGAEA